MPPAGGEPRGELRATVGRLAHERFTDERVGEWLEAAEPRDELEADVVRVARRDFDKARRVPGELVAELARAGVAARGAWLQAREDGDYASFAPSLERNVELRRRYSACFPEAAHPYDPLLDDYEPGMSTADVREALERLRDGLVPLVAAAPEIDDTLLRVGPFAEAGQRRLLITVLRAIGVDEEQWRLDEAAHPFEATIAQTDVRLTTRYDEADLDSLYSALHEFGHGLYEQQVDPALSRTPVGGGASSACTSRRAGCGRTWSAARRASGAGASRTRRRRCPSASAARPGRRSSGPPTPSRPWLIRVERGRGDLRAAHRPALRARAGAHRGRSRRRRPPRGLEGAHARLPRPRACPTTPRRAAGHPLGRGRLRLLPDLRAGQRHRRSAVAARDRRPPRPRRAARGAATSRRCASGWPSTSTATAAAT